LIVSLGSSTVIGNIIAGLVITYMRPFKMGDRIKLNDTTGDIIEKTPLVTRIRTPRRMRINPPISNNIFMLFSLLVAKIINLEMVMSKTIRMFALFLMKC
jgi:hypothetical protein